MTPITLRLLLAITCLTTLPHGAASAENSQRDPPMTMHETTYVNACSPQGQRELRTILNDAKIASRTQLWNLVYALLCGDPTPAAERLIAGSMTATVINRHAGTGQDDLLGVIHRNAESARSLMASRKAWGASVRVERDGVTVNYHSDEVCVSGRRFYYAKTRWRIAEVGEACD